MKHVVDLELWSAAGSADVPFDGKIVAEQCRSATNLPADVVLGLNFVPDRTDVVNLQVALSDNPELESKFTSFCRKQGFSTDPGDAVSAAHFIAQYEGQPLAWLHFPVEAAGMEMAAVVHAWAKRLGYVIRKGQGEPVLSGAEINSLWATKD